MPPPRKSNRTQRITLEPIGRFAFLVVGAHVLVGAGLWWWLSQSSGDPAGSPAGQQVTWMSPSDFTASTPLPEAKPVVPAPPPDTPPAAPPAPPSPAPVAAVEPKAEVPMPAAPPAEKENNHEVPKAIALDPAQAIAIMAKAREAEAAAKAEADKKAVGTASAPPPVPTSPPPTPAAMAAPKPPDSTPSQPPPATETSRFVTVSLKASTPGSPSKTSPKVASLLDMAALDAQGTGVAGAATGVRVDEVDRAIIDAFMREWVPPDASQLKRDQRTAHLDMSIDRGGRVLTFKLTQPSGSIDLDMSVLEAADRLDKIGAQLPASYPKDRYDFQVNLHAE